MLRAALVAVLAADACMVGNVKINNPVTEVQKTAANLSGNKVCTPAELHRYDFSADDEYWFGRSIAERLLSGYVAKGNVYEPDTAQAIYLNQVGQVVVAAAISQRDEGGGDSKLPRKYPQQARIDDVPDRPMEGRGFHFILVKDPAPVALGLPGGFVVVSDGMIGHAADEDQLAGILAHEVAHVQRGHGVRAVQVSMCANSESAATQVSKSVKASTASVHLSNTAVAGAINNATEMFQNQFIKQGYGAPAEAEADAYGTRYLSGAGYSALGVADFLRKIDTDPAFANEHKSGHFAPHLRAADVEKEVAAEKLDPPHSPYEADRSKRFASAFPSPAPAKG